MPKGHSTLEPRIAALEAIVTRQDAEIKVLRDQLGKALMKLDAGIPSMYPTQTQYESNFVKWPQVQVNGSQK